MNKKIAYFVISILIITSSMQIKGNLSNDVSIIIGPYPQNTDMYSTNIIWQTNIKTNNNSVHFGLTSECNQIVNKNNLTDFHKIMLYNLKNSTKYYYKVISDGIESNIYNFFTLFEDNKSFKFLVYGDTRGVWDNWKNASLVAKKIEKEQLNFALHTGDFVKDGRVINQWIDFFSISKFIHNCTIYPILGNHEYYGISYFQYFSIPDNNYWYSFDNGPIHFIGLDSNKRNLYNLNQTIWLIKDLIKNDKPFTIVYFHHPPYSSGNHGSTYSIRLIWKPIFSYFNIDIVFNGHDHCYERGNIDGIYYIVTGGGGAPLYKIGNKWWTIYSEKSYHYCLITIDNNILSFQAKNIDGIIIDEFSIEKNIK